MGSIFITIHSVMVLVNNFEGEGVKDLFNQAIANVKWSKGLNDDIKRVLILSMLYEGLCTRRFYCTEFFALSRNQARFNKFGYELENNKSLEASRGFIRDMFTKFINNRVKHLNNSLPLEPPRLKRSIVLSVLHDRDGNYALYRNGKASGYNITVPVESLADLERDF